VKAAATNPKIGLEMALSLASGVLFSVGLAISGMTQPAKVVAFLDIAGRWDPSLAFVMGAATLVYFTAFRLVMRQTAPLVGEFHLPTQRDIEPKLVVGAALFGVGWGLAGYCPGPALVSLATGSASAFTFVAAMAIGMLLFDAVDVARA
jgi:uncharacterized protein